MDTHELAWAAGFFDGEGHAAGTLTHLNLQVVQVDRRTLDRFRDAVDGIGKVGGPYRARNPKHSPQHRFQVANFEGVQAIIAMLWKYLGEAKREQAKKALETYNAAPRGWSNKGRTTCIEGHELHAQPNGHRACRPCQARRSRESYRRREVGD